VSDQYAIYSIIAGVASKLILWPPGI